MYKIIKKAFLMACCIGLLSAANAQVTNTSTTSKRIDNPTESDYEHLLQAKSKVAFRTYAIQSLNLSEQQIKDFDPMYADYMKAKNEIAQRKTKLINDYIKEMAEDDSPRNEENDKEEFIEDYLELEVAESKLRKETFDRMEDKITADNAFGFLLLQDMADNNYYQNMLQPLFQPYLIINTTEISPSSTSSNTMSPSGTTPKTATTPNATANSNTTDKHTTTTPKSTMTSNTTPSVDRKYRTDIDAYSTWVKSTAQAPVKDPHFYTRNGLKSLVAAISALNMTCKASMDDAGFETSKRTILQNCDKLGVDPSSDEHPDIMRESFVMASDMLKSVLQKCNYTGSSNAVMQVAQAAQKIDVNKTSMAQADAIKDFFKKAQVAIDDMASDISWSSN